MARRHKSGPGPYLRDVEIDYERVEDPQVYPFNLPAVRRMGVLAFHPRVTFLVGENGSGKSTLLEAIAVCLRLNPEGGSRNFNFATNASHSPLYRALRLARFGALPADVYFLRAESFYNVASEVDRLGVTPGYGGRSLHAQSHGESFFALFEHRFRREHGLYLMDEPEAALSPRRQLEFVALLHTCVERGCQFVIATHSPIIMAYPQATIYALDGDAVHPVRYEDTDHFLITRGFLANPRRTLDLLLREPPKQASSGDAIET